MVIKGITFDLWDTVIHDDTDEPKRRAQGLRDKPQERRHLLWQALGRHQAIDRAVVDAVFGVQEAAFRRIWYGHNVTITVAERLDMLLAGLGRDLPAADHDALVDAYEGMELAVRPDPVPGAAEAIRELARDHVLGVVSDTIYTPGRNLREILAGFGVVDLFSGFAFSDEVGHSKPHPDMFRAAAAQMGTPLDAMVHIGDREPKDVAGAQAVGMKAILFTAVRDEGARETTQAAAVVDGYGDLVAAVRRLDGAGASA